MEHSRQKMHEEENQAFFWICGRAKKEKEAFFWAAKDT